ncbi:MAG: IMPACT family protein [Saccharofermentanales bacterium]
METKKPDSGKIPYSRESYVTPDHFAKAEFVEKKSIFYAWVSPIRSEKDAAGLIAEARAQYPDARHHVYAWTLGGNEQRNKYSDDGEPSGTAGLPVLDILRKNSVEDAVIIVVRYFGGTLLGTGGLVRAYSEAAALALQASVPVTVSKCAVFECTASYSDFERIRRALKNSGSTISVLEYSENIVFEIVQPYEKKETLIPAFNDAGCGRASINFKEIRYVKIGTDGSADQ